MHLTHKKIKDVEINDILFLPVEYREPYGNLGNLEIIQTGNKTDVNVKSVTIFPVRITNVSLIGSGVCVSGFAAPTSYDEYTPDTVKLLEQKKELDWKFYNSDDLVLYCK